MNGYITTLSVILYISSMTFLLSVLGRLSIYRLSNVIRYFGILISFFLPVFLLRKELRLQLTVDMVCGVSNALRAERRSEILDRSVLVRMVLQCEALAI